MTIDPEELLEEEPQEPIAHVRVVYTGAVAPHWDIQGVFGDETAIDDFRARAIARLQLLPPHDPQFRRNRERVNRDGERENFIVEWDLGYDEEEADATALGDKPPSEAAGASADEVGEDEGETKAGGEAASEGAQPLQ